MKRVNFHLTDKQIQLLHKQAKETGLKTAELIRRAIDAFFVTQNERNECETKK